MSSKDGVLPPDDDQRASASEFYANGAESSTESEGRQNVLVVHVDVHRPLDSSVELRPLKEPPPGPSSTRSQESGAAVLVVRDEDLSQCKRCHRQHSKSGTGACQKWNQSEPSSSGSQESDASVFVVRAESRDISSCKRYHLQHSGTGAYQRPYRPGPSSAERHSQTPVRIRIEREDVGKCRRCRRQHPKSSACQEYQDKPGPSGDQCRQKKSSEVVTDSSEMDWTGTRWLEEQASKHWQNWHHGEQDPMHGSKEEATETTRLLGNRPAASADPQREIVTYAQYFKRLGYCIGVFVLSLVVLFSLWSAEILPTTALIVCVVLSVLLLILLFVTFILAGYVDSLDNSSHQSGIQDDSSSGVRQYISGIWSNISHRQ